MKVVKKIPDVFEAHQWFQNGDHPLDYINPSYEFRDGETRTISAQERKERGFEGDLVRRSTLGDTSCTDCGEPLYLHGAIDISDDDWSGVCPGDWVVSVEHRDCASYLVFSPEIFAEIFQEVAE